MSRVQLSQHRLPSLGHIPKVSSCNPVAPICSTGIRCQVSPARSAPGSSRSSGNVTKASILRGPRSGLTLPLPLGAGGRGPRSLGRRLPQLIWASSPPPWPCWLLGPQASGGPEAAPSSSCQGLWLPPRPFLGRGSAFAVVFLPDPAPPASGLVFSLPTSEHCSAVLARFGQYRVEPAHAPLREPVTVRRSLVWATGLGVISILWRGCLEPPCVFLGEHARMFLLGPRRPVLADGTGGSPELKPLGGRAPQPPAAGRAQWPPGGWPSGGCVPAPAFQAKATKPGVPAGAWVSGCAGPARVPRPFL